MLTAKERLPNYLGNDATHLENILLQFHIPEDGAHIKCPSTDVPCNSVFFVLTSVNSRVTPELSNKRLH